MKLSVTLSDDDVAVVDAYAREAGLPSRSAALQHAIRFLRHPHLEDDYVDAWTEWDGGGEDVTRVGTVGDGLDDAAR